MTVSLLMDHHVHAAITEGLRQRGVDAITAYEDNSHRLEDDVLLGRATQLGRVLFSQDEDLLRIAKSWIAISREFSGLVYAHQVYVSIGQAVYDLELIAKINEPEDMYNRVEYLPL